MIIEEIRAFLEQSAEFKSRLPADLKQDDSLIESGIVDSFGIITLITFLEPTFNIKIGAEDLAQENFETLNAIQAFITRKMSGK